MSEIRTIHDPEISKCFISDEELLNTQTSSLSYPIDDNKHLYIEERYLLNGSRHVDKLNTLEYVIQGYENKSDMGPGKAFEYKMDKKKFFIGVFLNNPVETVSIRLQEITKNNGRSFYNDLCGVRIVKYHGGYMQVYPILPVEKGGKKVTKCFFNYPLARDGYDGSQQFELNFMGGIKLNKGICLLPEEQCESSDVILYFKDILKKIESVQT